MEPHLEDLRAVIDREKIRDCLARIARGEDRRDPEILKGCFWPDSGVDFGIFIGSFDEYLAWVTPGAPSIPVTLHTLGQSLIDLSGDKAAVETHITSYHRVDFGQEHRDVVMGGRYLDRMERRDGEWRVAQRTMLYDWLQDFGVAVDWSKGLMGMPFLTTHSVGAANGDHSVSFFS
jgi:hypothetical protein